MENTNSFQKEQTLLINRSLLSLTSYPPFTPSQPHKQYLSQHRPLLIRNLKQLTTKYILHMENYLDVLYLSIHYLDIILTKYQLSLPTEQSHVLLSLCCFNLSLKFIGNFDKNINHIIHCNTKQFIKQYSLFENQCLLYLNYDLVYVTTYDYLNLILTANKNVSNEMIIKTKEILFNFINNDYVILNQPFIIAIALIKFTKEILKINYYDYYDRYFKHDKVKEVYQIIKKDYNECQAKMKLIKEDANVNNVNMNTHNNSPNWDDIKTMSSTFEEDTNVYSSNKKMNIEQRNSLRNSFKYMPVHTDIKYNLNTSKVFTRNNNNVNTRNRDCTYGLDRCRNNSAKINIRRNLSMNNVHNEYNKMGNVGVIRHQGEKINFDLGQMSKISFDKLAKMSIRYIKKK